MEKINTAVAALEKSPLFNLSLASKELFHSNFLEWVMKEPSIHETATILLRAFGGDEDLDPDTLGIPEREKNNFDLTLMVKDRGGKQYRIVIENKVKSIPSRDQLDGYSVKLFENPKGVYKTIAILLSLSPPEFFNGAKYYDPKNGEPRWRYHGYDTVVKCLEHGCSEGSYHGALLNDYRGFVQNLIGLQAAIQNAFDNHPDALINPFSWPEKKKESLYSQLKEIRMHDVFEKWRMIALQKRLQKMIRAEDREALNISSDFTNGLGLLDISPKIKPSKESFFKIQLQGTQLRQVLQKDNAHGKEVFKQAEQLLKDNQWFRTADGGPLPECGSEANKFFCKYGDGFVYRHEQLRDISRLRDLVLELSKTPFPAGN